jgi:hypothetical protein
MSRKTQDRSQATVERARQRAKSEEKRRTARSAKRVAVARTEALQRRTGLRRFVFENGLGLAAMALFVFAFAGQAVAGHRAHNEEEQQHGQPAVGFGAYLTSGAFLEATAENWESEFLQMGLFVLLTAFLYQRGSSESKRIEEPEAVDQDPHEGRGDPESPWPVRRGGLPLALYKHSLSLALLLLFAVSFVVHAVGGAMEYSEEQVQHGGAPISALVYVGTSRFWFESFQNWQSEFFSVGVLVLLSIWLREQGSSQSKPVAAAAGETGE